MNLRIDYYKDGARRAEGLCVVIDVFRACSVLCYAASKDPNQIIISNDYAQIIGLKETYRDAILIGKNHDPSQIIFNTNNSPTEILATEMLNKTIIHFSEGGISGLLECKHADEVITGSFVNAKAVSEYIRSKPYDIVTLVCMGYLGTEYSEEDYLCAKYIKSLINNESIDTTVFTESLSKTMGKHFLNPENGIPKDDFFYCLDYNRFDFVLKLAKDSNVNRLSKISVCN
jgi:2-phosphosulfolactate phosphatase